MGCRGIYGAWLHALQHLTCTQDVSCDAPPPHPPHNSYFRFVEEDKRLAWHWECQNVPEAAFWAQQPANIICELQMEGSLGVL